MIELSQLTPKQLRRAASVQERIVTLQHKLNAILGAHVGASSNGTPGKRRMSAAGRAAIAAAARRRWAKHRAGTGKGAGRRKMSSAGRARLSALARARWKAAKAAGRVKL